MPSATPALNLTTGFDASVNATVENLSQRATNLYDIVAFNEDAAVRWLQLFNALAANVTIGTTPPTISLPLSQDASPNLINIYHFDPPLRFSVALSYAITTTVNGLTGPTVAGVVNFGYT